MWRFPGGGVKSELQLTAYTTATARQDPSHICDLRHSSRQCWILYPLSETRDQTRNLMVPGQIHFHGITTETPTGLLNKYPLLGKDDVTGLMPH